jgi:hypothetical protein
MALATAPKPGDVSDATDYPSVASLGGGVFGRMGGADSDVVFAMGASGLRRLLDVVLPEQQLFAEDHINVWEPSDGSFAPGFPAQMHDLMFFNTPAMADVTGDGQAEVLQSSAMYDLQAYGGALGQPAEGFPKFTGGWSVMTPAVGDLDGDGTLDVALATREGNLFVWRTAGEACQATEWPKYQHDLHNTGDYRTDARRPGVVTSLRLEGDTLTFTTSGGDGRCGQATALRVLVDGVAVAVSATPGAPGTVQSVKVPALKPGAVDTVQAVDAAGNVSPPATVRVLGAQTERAAPAETLPATGAAGTSGATGDVGLLLLGLAAATRALRGNRSRNPRPIAS